MDLILLKKLKLKQMENKFMKFWRKYGPYILFGTGITQFVILENWVVGSLFIIMGVMLMNDND